MPYSEVYPLGGTGDIIQDILTRLQILEARSRVMQNASTIVQNGSGNTVALFGQLSDGSYGMEVQDGADNVILRLNQTGLHNYDSLHNVINLLDSAGLHNYNDAGTELTRLDANGLHSAVGGTTTNLSNQPYIATVQHSGTITFSTSATWTSLSDSVTCQIGTSGTAVILMSAYGTATPAATAQESMLMGVGVDGANPDALITWEIMWNLNAGSDNVSMAAAAARTITGLSAGSHTFALYGKQGTGTGTVYFSNMDLTVIGV